MGKLEPQCQDSSGDCYKNGEIYNNYNNFHPNLETVKLLSSKNNRNYN